MRATASTRCSQLSRMSRRDLPLTADATPSPDTTPLDTHGYRATFGMGAVLPVVAAVLAFVAARAARKIDPPAIAGGIPSNDNGPVPVTARKDSPKSSSRTVESIRR